MISQKASLNCVHLQRVLCLSKVMCASDKLEVVIKNVPQTPACNFSNVTLTDSLNLTQNCAFVFRVTYNQNPTSLMAVIKIKQLMEEVETHTEVQEGTDTRATGLATGCFQSGLCESDSSFYPTFPSLSHGLPLQRCYQTS